MPRQKQQREKTVWLIGHQTEIIFYVGGHKRAASEKYHAKWDLPPEPSHDPDTDGAFFSAPWGRACAIWIPGNPSTPDEYAAAAHECVHAAFHILSRCGVEYSVHTDPDGHAWVNDEPWTYLVAGILESLLEFARTRNPEPPGNV